MKNYGHNPKDILPLGQIVGTRQILGMTPEQRAWHMHVIGATGSGKTKFLEHLVRQDILEHRGLCLMDPEGDLAENILGWVSRIPYPPKKFLYIAPWRDDWTIVYNPLGRAALDDWFLVNQLKRAIAKCWGADSTVDTPMLDLWLKTCIYTGVRLALTLPEIGMLLNPTIERNIQRRAIIEQLPESDVEIRARWEQLCYFAEKKPAEFEASAGSTIRRLAGFLDNPRLRRIFGVPDVTLDLAQAMDEGAVIIVDLSIRGRIDEGDVMTFGTLLLTDFFCQMQMRQSTRPFTLYVDEFQDYVTKDIARMLDRARKRGLQLVLSHQRPGQLLNTDDPGVRDVWSAIQNNCRTKVVFGGIKQPEELKEITSVLSLGALDPYKVKAEIHSRKVVDYVKEYWKSRTTGSTFTSSSSTGHSSTQGAGFGSMRAQGAGTVYSGEAFLPEMLHTTESRSWSDYVSAMNAESDSWGSSESTSSVDMSTEMPVLVPVMGEELSARYYLPLEEQLYQFMAIVSQQQQRQAMVRIDGQNEPVPIEVPYVKPIVATDDDKNHQLSLAYKASDCYFPVPHALALVSARQEEFQRLGQPTHVPTSDAHARMKSSISPPTSMPHESATSFRIGSLELQPRDLALLRDVFENRFISIKHAAALHWPGLSAGDAAAKRRLAKLAEAGLLQQQQVEIEGCRVIYRLTKESVDLLAERELIPRIVRTDWSDKMRKRYTDEIRPSHLAHELSLYDLKAAFTSAVNQHAHLRIGELGIWPLPYAFPVTRKGRVTKQLPDGFLRIDEHSPSDDGVPVSHYFYLELDNGGNEKLDTLAEKAEGYRSHLRSGAFATALGTDANATFRVLVVVAAQASAARRDNICARIGALGIHTLVWAATMQEVLAGPLETVWITPKALAEDPTTPAKLPLLDDLSTQGLSGSPCP